jgi:hypothetical protein
MLGRSFLGLILSFTLAFLEVFTKLRKATVSFVMSALSHGTTWHPLDAFSLNVVFDDFLKNISRKYKFR